MAHSNPLEVYDVGFVNQALIMLESIDSRWHLANPQSDDSQQQFEVVFSTPERPFGRPNQLDAKRSVNMHPTPYISIARLDPIFDPFHSNYVAANIGYQDPSNKTTVVFAKNPPAYIIPYQIDFRGRYIQDINDALMVFYYTTYPQFVIQFDFGFPWGVKRIVIRNDGRIVDLSTLEETEGERWIRKTMTFNVEAYLFGMGDSTFQQNLGLMKVTPTVKDIVWQVYNSYDDTLLETIDIGSVYNLGWLVGAAVADEMSMNDTLVVLTETL